MLQAKPNNDNQYDTISLSCMYWPEISMQSQFKLIDNLPKKCVDLPLIWEKSEPLTEEHVCASFFIFNDINKWIDFCLFTLNHSSQLY